MFRGLFVALVLASGCSSPPNRTAADGGAIDAGPEVCTPFATRGCDGDGLYFYDSCGERGELIDECNAPNECNPLPADCCLQPSTAVVARTNQPATIDWSFPDTGDRLSIPFTVLSAGGNYGMLFTARFTLGADTVWLGPQYPLSNGQTGLLFSRLAYRGGLADLQVDSASAYTESGEVGSGDFVGIRQPYPFEPGDYRIDLVRGAADGAADWFELSLTALESGETLVIGSLKAVRISPGTPVEIPSQLSTVLDLYGYSVPATIGSPPQRNNADAVYGDVPTWAWRTWYLVADQAPTAIDSSYTTDDGGNDFANLEIQVANERLFLGLGADIGRCSPDGSLLEP